MSEPGHWFESDPLWFKRAVFYEIHIARLLRLGRRRLGRPARRPGEARLPAVARHRLHLAAADVRVARSATAATTSPTSTASIPTTAPSTTSASLVEAAHRRGDPRDRRPRHEPHLERSPVVPGVALEPATPRSATGTSGRTPTTAGRARGSSSSTPSRRTGRGTRSPAQYYWHRFFSHQPDLNYDNPEVQEAMLDALRFWLDLGHRRLPPRRRAVPLRARGDERREPPRDARVPEARARRGRRALPGPRAARRGEPVAGRRRRLLRRRRRVPHGLPLPGHAAHVHGAAPRGRDPDLRDPRRRRRRSPTTASGASSCATTTS